MFAGLGCNNMQKDALKKVWCVLLFAALVSPNFPAVGFAESSCPGIHIKIHNIKNSTGTIVCALFESSIGFPTEYMRYAISTISVEIHDMRARCDFVNIPPGIYSIAVIHDENRNGKLDTNWLGIPTESFGFSNDANALLGAPSFSAASFLYQGRDMELTIGLQ